MKFPISTIKIATLGGIASLTVATISIRKWYIESTAPSITGSWEIEFETLESSLSRYQGMKVMHRVEFIQKGTEVEGIGESWSANGEDLPMSRHRKIEFRGTFTEDILRCSYTFHGKERESVGSMTCELDESEKSLAGTFKGTAANSSGKILGKKLD